MAQGSAVGRACFSGAEANFTTQHSMATVTQPTQLCFDNALNLNLLHLHTLAITTSQLKRTTRRTQPFTPHGIPSTARPPPHRHPRQGPVPLLTPRLRVFLDLGVFPTVSIP